MCRAPLRRCSGAALRAAALPVQRPTLLLSVSSVSRLHGGHCIDTRTPAPSPPARWRAVAPPIRVPPRHAPPQSPPSATPPPVCRLVRGASGALHVAGGRQHAGDRCFPWRRATLWGGEVRHARPRARGRARGGGRRGACPAAVNFGGRCVFFTDGRCALRIGERGKAFATWPPPPLLRHVWGGGGGGVRKSSGR